MVENESNIGNELGFVTTDRRLAGGIGVRNLNRADRVGTSQFALIYCEVGPFPEWSEVAVELTLNLIPGCLGGKAGLIGHLAAT